MWHACIWLLDDVLETKQGAAIAMSTLFFCEVGPPMYMPSTPQPLRHQSRGGRPWRWSESHAGMLSSKSLKLCGKAEPDWASSGTITPKK
jgi:hypothetical protein